MGIGYVEAAEQPRGLGVGGAAQDGFGRVVLQQFAACEQGDVVCHKAGFGGVVRYQHGGDLAAAHQLARLALQLAAQRGV